MQPPSASNSHSNLLARRFPLIKDCVIFIRFILAFIHSHRAHSVPSIFQIPLRPKLTSGKSKDSSKDRPDEEPEAEPTNDHEQELKEESIGELEEHSEEKPEEEFEEESREVSEGDLGEDLEEEDEEAGEDDLEEDLEEGDSEAESDDDSEEIFENVFGDLFSGTSPQTPPSSPPAAEKCSSPSSAAVAGEEEEEEEEEEVLQQFHWNDEYPNFTILCENHRYLVHKHILEANSPYFERMFRFNGKEATNKEATLQSIDPSLIAHILSFMYTNSYTLPGGSLIPTSNWCNHRTAALLTGPAKASSIFKRKCPCRGKTLSATHLLPHVSIYALSDYFSMPNLKEYARKATRDVLHACWNESEEELALAEALEEAFCGTPDEDRGVRDALVETLKEHPGLWVDEGAVAQWLDKHEDVREEVDPAFKDGGMEMGYNGGHKVFVREL